VANLIRWEAGLGVDQEYDPTEWVFVAEAVPGVITDPRPAMYAYNGGDEGASVFSLGERNGRATLKIAGSASTAPPGYAYLYTTAQDYYAFSRQGQVVSVVQLDELRYCDVLSNDEYSIYADVVVWEPEPGVWEWGLAACRYLVGSDSVIRRTGVPADLKTHVVRISSNPVEWDAERVLWIDGVHVPFVDEKPSWWDSSNGYVQLDDSFLSGIDGLPIHDDYGYYPGVMLADYNFGYYAYDPLDGAAGQLRMITGTIFEFQWRTNEDDAAKTANDLALLDKWRIVVPPLVVTGSAYDALGGAARAAEPITATTEAVAHVSGTVTLDDLTEG
jgi:hypothetical protein